MYNGLSLLEVIILNFSGGVYIFDHQEIDSSGHSCGNKLYFVTLYFQARRRFAGATACIPSATITKQEYHRQTQGLLGNS